MEKFTNIKSTSPLLTLWNGIIIYRKGLGGMRWGGMGGEEWVGRGKVFKEVPQHNAVSPLLAPELQYIYQVQGAFSIAMNELNLLNQSCE